MRNEKGFSLVELMIVVLVIGILAALAVPNLSRSQLAARESKAISAVRSLVTAQITYSTKAGSGNFAGDLGTLETAGLIDSVLGSGTTDSYLFSVSGSGTLFQVQARPLVYDVTGIRSFYSDESAVIRYTTADAAATSSSLGLGEQ